MKIIIRITAFLPLFFCFLGCSKDLKLDLEVSEKKIVLNALLSDTGAIARLSLSTSLLDTVFKQEDLWIKEGKVELIDSITQTTIPFSYEVDNIYNLQEVLSPTNAYKVRASFDGFDTVESDWVKILPPAIINQINVKKEENQVFQKYKKCFLYTG